MKNATVIFGPSVDAAVRDMIDYVNVDSIPNVITFLDRIQQRLVRTLSLFPESGSPFQVSIRIFVVEGYSFLYEYHPESNEVHVLEMKAPGMDWR